MWRVNIMKPMTTAKIKEERVKEKYVNAIEHVHYSSHSYIVCNVLYVLYKINFNTSVNNQQSSARMQH